MDQDQFWKIIEDSRIGTPDITDRAEKLRCHLLALTPDEVVSFSDQFAHRLNEAYSWHLWGAAYLILGGMSDDGFWDFRSSLISLGREDFYRILQNPDEISRLPTFEQDNLFAQCYQSIDDEVYRSLTGADLNVGTVGIVSEPSGQQWSEDDVDFLRHTYPKLFAANSLHEG